MSFEPFGAWGERGDGRKESAFNEIDNDRSIRSFDGIVLHLWEEEKGQATLEVIRKVIGESDRFVVEE